jgi:2-polyprenyl-3-methyl-5-hydroxy-6-metoxy-1,4-benzoquinol methylase
MMAQTFENESFDLVITSDVFEHLPDVAPAVREILRTLKPGGAHIFTVPWIRWKKTLVRTLVKRWCPPAFGKARLSWQPAQLLRQTNASC